MASFTFLDKINPAVADHINNELPAHIEAAYAIATQSDWALNVVSHKQIITGIIADAAGPAPNKPDINDVNNIITISSSLGFVIIFCIEFATVVSTPVCDMTLAKNKNDAIVRTGLKSTNDLIWTPHIAEYTIPITHPSSAITSGGIKSCGTVLQHMNINTNITNNPFKTFLFTSIFLYLLCNKSIDKFFFLSVLSFSFMNNCHQNINAIDIIKKNGNALNKYALNEVIPLFIITMAGKSPIGDEAPPVFDNASITAKNIFTYFWFIPIAFNKTNIIGSTINTAVILFKNADTKKN